MNTINSTYGQTLATDGQYFFNNGFQGSAHRAVNVQNLGTLPDSAKEVTENMSNMRAQAESTVVQLQKLSDMMGTSLQFHVNNDSGNVVIKVLNSSTNEVIREIPSEDIQKIQARMRQQIGLLFDEII